MSAQKIVRKPTWLVEFRRRMALFDIIEMAYEDGCNCPVCEKIREFGEELGQVLGPLPGPEVRQVRP